MRVLLALTLVPALLLAPLTAAAATCITDKSSFGAYKQRFAADAQAAGIGGAGLQALANARMSDITWRFESRPSTQTGTLQSDPATFLAKRSGSSAEAFVNLTKRKIANNPNTFRAIEDRFGVPASILATIWGLETSWGGYTGGSPIVGAAVTLSSYCRRHPRFEPHAIAALRLVDKGVLNSASKGGPSGELGHMQFLAGNWERYGFDATGDGRADPMNAVDALATAANMLAQNGWQRGQPYAPGTANFGVLSVWNDSGNYQRAIAYSAGLVDR
ncbi:MAG: lytic murein transglycosylase [Pseudomonadota bacterium]